MTGLTALNFTLTGIAGRFVMAAENPARFWKRGALEARLAAEVERRQQAEAELDAVKARLDRAGTPSGHHSPMADGHVGLTLAGRVMVLTDERDAASARAKKAEAYVERLTQGQPERPPELPLQAKIDRWVDLASRWRGYAGVLERRLVVSQDDALARAEKAEAEAEKWQSRFERNAPMAYVQKQLASVAAGREAALARAREAEAERDDYRERAKAATLTRDADWQAYSEQADEIRRERDEARAERDDMEKRITADLEKAMEARAEAERLRWALQEIEQLVDDPPLPTSAESVVKAIGEVAGAALRGEEK